MMHISQTNRFFVALLSTTAWLTIGHQAVQAQLKEVVVGVTIKCPYENAIETNCWSGAYWALTKLDGIQSVESKANGYNCTARVYVKEGIFPDPAKWTAQFKEQLDETVLFRGVEITARGTVTDTNPMLFTIPGAAKPVALKKLEHKLQWNSKKKSAREPEPSEKDAYEQLVLEKANFEKEVFEITGPLLSTEDGMVLEVREFSKQK